MRQFGTSEPQPADLLVRGGTVIDGTGAAPLTADVAVSAGRVVAVAPRLPPHGARVIDASGCVVSPGFVDTHTHSDVMMFLGEEHEALRLAGVRQGVTVEIAGNCGFSVFPSGPKTGAAGVQRHLAALFGRAVRVFDGYQDYARAVEAAGSAGNLASLVGQGTLRGAVVGFDPRPATAEEMETMRRETVAALRDGAFGLSSGLLYPPGSHASTSELVALAEVAAREGTPYVSHIRNEMDAVEAAVEEAVEIGRRAGAAVHISHLKAAGRANHGRLPALLAILDAARRSGQDVSADAYPYTAGSTVLHALLPPWVTEGGTTAMARRLADAAARERIRADFADPPAGWQNFLAGGSWDDVIVASAPRSPDAEGRTVGELAAETGQDPIDVAAELLIAEEAAVTVIVEMADAGDVSTCLASSLTMVGSDGIPIPGKPHPRWAGSFAKMLSAEGRRQTGLSLPEVVRKMTSRPAERFGLVDRGVIRPGAVADLVVFDPDRVQDRATYRDPLAPPEGIPSVVVNGAVVIEDGEDTGRRPGRVLRRRPAGIETDDG